MKKVKVFFNKFPKELEDEINVFLKKVHPDTCIHIVHSMVVDNFNVIYYSAIVYMEY